MNIQLLSDLHFEAGEPGSDSPVAWTYDIPVRADYLALLGDTARACDDRLFTWLDEQVQKFRIVFFVAGNHEPRGSSLVESTARLEAYEAKINVAESSYYGRFVFLNRTRFDLTPTLTILGCTLWGSLDATSPAVQSLADFTHIRDFTPEAFTAAHQADLAWLNTTVVQMAREEPGRSVVVFTHHAPTVEGTSNPKMVARPTSAAFATELIGQPVWTSGNVKFWAFGHTHWCCDFIRDGIRIYSNQKGRGDGIIGYDRQKVLRL